MSKLTIFFIIATVLIVSVTGTLLAFKYFTDQDDVADQNNLAQQESFKSDDSLDFENLLKNADKEPEIVPEPETIPSDPPPSMPDPFALSETDEDEPIDMKEILAGIDEEKIEKAGFKDTILEVEEFDGFVFNDFNMAEYNDDDHILYILLSGEEESARITELIFPSKEISDEVYASLKAKMEQSGYFDVNETDQYGDHSYFANHDTEKNTVFLVVKIRERLYTLHYPAKNHNKIKNLINQL